MYHSLQNYRSTSHVGKVSLLAFVLCSAVLACASDQFEHAEYFQATSSGQKKAGGSVKGTLSFNGDKKTMEFLDHGGNVTFSIKCESIKTLLYERAARPRYAEAVLISPLFLLSHSKKHYLTIQYTSDAGDGQYAIVQLDKKNAQAAVAAAEAHTGKRVERVEEK
jgi:hypothetical protein